MRYDLCGRHPWKIQWLCWNCQIDKRNTLPFYNFHINGNNYNTNRISKSFKKFINGPRSELVEINMNNGKQKCLYILTNRGYSLFSEQFLYEFVSNYLLGDLSKNITLF